MNESLVVVVGLFNKKIIIIIIIISSSLHTSTTLHCINTGTYRTGININTQVPGMKTRFQFLFLFLGTWY